MEVTDVIKLSLSAFYGKKLYYMLKLSKGKSLRTQAVILAINQTFLRTQWLTLILGK